MSAGGSLTLADVEAVVRENVTGHIDGDRHEQGKQRLLTALRQGNKPGGARRKRRLLALAAAVALVSGGGAYAWKHRTSPHLTYAVAGGLLSDSGYVRSSDPSGARLSFSDGTRIELRDGARARIAAVDARGARIAIENGRAALSVAGQPGAAWYVDAGPFVIQVQGTQLDVDWSSYDDTLSVDLHDGTLVVSGPPAPSGVLLRAGQRLTAHEGRLSIEALEAAARVVEAAAELELPPDVDVTAPPPDAELAPLASDEQLADAVASGDAPNP